MAPARHSYLLGILLLALLLARSAGASPSCYSEKAESWANFVANFQGTWQGLWIRASGAGAMYASTGATRTWQIPAGDLSRPPKSMIHTNRYFNASYNENGDVERRWRWTPGKPLQRLFPNGTVLPALPAPIFFTRGGESFALPEIAFEAGAAFLYQLTKVFVHPDDPRVRVTISFLYLRGDFWFVLVIREVRGAPVYPSVYWTADKSVSLLDDLPPLLMRREWMQERECLTMDRQVCTQRLGPVTSEIDLPAQPKESMLTLQLPDGLMIHVPKNIAGFRRRPLQFMFLWKISSMTVKRSVSDFDRQGKLIQECTFTYTRR